MNGLFEVVRKAVHPQAIELLKNSLLIEKDVFYHEKRVDPNNVGAFSEADNVTMGDHFNKYSAMVGEGMMVTLLPLVQSITGKRLFPTYSFVRFYYKDSVLHRHRDRPSCEYSMTMCIESDPEPWPIFVDGVGVSLNPGDLVVYKGCDAWHWREPYKGNRTIQIFMHYVDANGPYSNFHYDRRDLLGLSGGGGMRPEEQLDYQTR
jgi:hypothetical protein